MELDTWILTNIIEKITLVTMLFPFFSTKLNLTRRAGFPICFFKGQLISKRFFEVIDFLQKTKENKSHTSKNDFIRSFFGGNRLPHKPFRNQLTFTWKSRLGWEKNLKKNMHSSNILALDFCTFKPDKSILPCLFCKSGDFL